MLPEEFRDIEGSGNSFTKALYELDYGMSPQQLIAELQDLDSRIAKTEIRLALLNAGRERLCEAICDSTTSDVILTKINGKIVAALINNNDVQIISAMVDDSCREQQDGDL